jgi:hypothetical protein
VILREEHLRAYYFWHRSKGPTTYIATLTPGTWDHWRDDWVIVQANAHDRLELPTDAPMGNHGGWEKVPNLQRAYDPVVRRI